MSVQEQNSLQPPVTAAQLVEQTLNLASMPAAYARLREVMDDEDSTMADVAEVVSLDPAISARLLRIANSAYYGLPSQVDTITRAASLIGVQQIHDLVLATSVANAFDGVPNELMDMNTFWFRSVSCGYLARELGYTAGLRQTEGLFVRGLLHDLGHLMLYNQFPELSREALASAGGHLIDLYSKEQDLIGCDACQVGVALMRKWGFPESMVESIASLDAVDVEQLNGREAGILNIAVWVTHGLDTDMLLKDICEAVPPVIWELTGLDGEKVEEVVNDFSEEMIEAMNQLFVGER